MLPSPPRSAHARHSATLAIAALLAVTAIPQAAAQAYGAEDDPAWINASWGSLPEDTCTGDLFTAECPGRSPSDRKDRTPPGFDGCPPSTIRLEARRLNESKPLDDGTIHTKHYGVVGVSPAGCKPGDMLICRSALSEAGESDAALRACGVDPLETSAANLQGLFVAEGVATAYTSVRPSVNILYCGSGLLAAPPQAPRIKCLLPTDCPELAPGYARIAAEIEGSYEVTGTTNYEGFRLTVRGTWEGRFELHVPHPDPAAAPWVACDVRLRALQVDEVGVAAEGAGQGCTTRMANVDLKGIVLVAADRRLVVHGWAPVTAMMDCGSFEWEVETGAHAFGELPAPTFTADGLSSAAKGPVEVPVGLRVNFVTYQAAQDVRLTGRYTELPAAPFEGGEAAGGGDAGAEGGAAGAPSPAVAALGALGVAAWTASRRGLSRKPS